MMTEYKNDISDEFAREILMDSSHKGLVPFEVNEHTFIERFCTGGQSVPLNVDNEYVVRLPKYEQTMQDMDYEHEVLALVNAHQPSTAVPDVQVVRDGVYPFAYHKQILGKTLHPVERENNVCYKELAEYQKALLAKDLAVFLFELHSIPLEEAQKLPQQPSHNTVYDHEANAKILAGYGIDLDTYKGQQEKGLDQVLCHNDLHGRNLAIDEGEEHVLRGVFDFGIAKVGRRSSDFVKLYNIDRNLARNTISEYNKISHEKVDIRDTDYAFLNSMAENLKKLPEFKAKSPEAAEEFMNITNAYMSAFKLDVLREKREGPSLKRERAEVGRNSFNNSYERELV